jgi:hypothetical protein
MDAESIKRLENASLSLHDFFELEDSEREWLIPMLSRNIRSTIELIKLIEEQPRTYSDLSGLICLHPNTIKQKLLALKRGGFPILMNEDVAVLETGRKRVLVRRVNEKDIIKLVEKGLKRRYE